MEVWHMREHLAARYPGWEKKLRKMPDDQIIAIYMRMQRTKPAEKSAKCVDAGLLGYKAPERYIYECHRCYQQFESENPDIQECRYCGAGRSDMSVCKKL